MLTIPIKSQRLLIGALKVKATLTKDKNLLTHLIHQREVNDSRESFLAITQYILKLQSKQRFDWLSVPVPVQWFIAENQAEACRPPACLSIGQNYWMHC